jgi:murein DD-endopeptidase MepM/ murein hydrolase activator NlpD
MPGSFTDRREVVNLHNVAVGGICSRSGAHSERMRLLIRSLGLAIGLLVLAPVPSSADGVGWRWPLDGTPVVARAFDPPPLPWLAGHRGVDLQARAGDPVRAAGAGVVGFAGLLAGRGVVTVHHAGGRETTYEPVTAAVRPGQRVATGQLLGRVQPGHGSCGIGFVCLHWGLRLGAAYLDPLQLVRAGPIRLLPVWRHPPAATVVEPVATPPARAAPSGSPHDGATRDVAVGAAAAGLAGALALALRRRR